MTIPIGDGLLLWYDVFMDTDRLQKLKTRILYRAALAAVGTFIFNTLGVWISLYGILWWYDIPMHFFGGLFTGLLVLHFLLGYKKTRYLPTHRIIFISLVLVCVIGLMWEGYEIVFDIVAGRRHFFLDSLSDIFFDMAGAVEAAFIYLRHRRIVLAS